MICFKVLCGDWDKQVVSFEHKWHINLDRYWVARIYMSGTCLLLLHNKRSNGTFNYTTRANPISLKFGHELCWTCLGMICPSESGQSQRNYSPLPFVLCCLCCSFSLPLRCWRSTPSWQLPRSPLGAFYTTRRAGKACPPSTWAASPLWRPRRNVKILCGWFREEEM